MKIMTFNIQNDMKKIPEGKTEALIELIRKENPDVIGLQELNNQMKKVLQKELTEYSFYGRSRFGVNFILDEYNSILIKRNIPVEETTTYSLGRNPNKVRSKNLLSIFPRICTTIVCVYKNQRIKIANTHIDHGLDRTKEYQLSVLYEVLKSNDYPLLLMGDFNMTSSNDNFQSFIKQSNLSDMCSNIGRTCKLSETDKAIDHILSDDRLKIDNVRKIDDFEYSDHFPIICEMDIKK